MAYEELNMEKGICYVVGAGENCGIDFMPTQEDVVIAADAGTKYLEECRIVADIIIGDFDTLGFIPKQSNVIVLNTEKDDTDMFAAVREGIKLGYKTFHIYCGVGGRIDHTIANLQMIAYLSELGKQGFLFDSENVITTISNSRLSFNEIPSGYISVFSYSERAEGVCLQGLKYELENSVLVNTFPLGVSNEFIGKKSSISVKCGTLLIVFPRKAKEEII